MAQTLSASSFTSQEPDPCVSVFSEQPSLSKEADIKLPEAQKTFSEETTALIQRLRAYAERSETIAGELCAEAAKHIEEVYSRPKGIDDQKLETFWIRKAIPRDDVKQNPDILAQQGQQAAYELAKAILATKCAGMDYHHDMMTDSYIYTWKVQFAEPPDSQTKPTIDDHALEARKQIEEQRLVHVYQQNQINQQMLQQQQYNQGIQNYQGINPYLNNQLGQYLGGATNGGNGNYGGGGGAGGYATTTSTAASTATYYGMPSSPMSHMPPHDAARAAIATAQKWLKK